MDGSAEDGRSEVPHIAEKLWGHERWFANTDRYAGKLLYISEWIVPRRRPSGVFAGGVRTGLVHGRNGLVRARYSGQVAVPFSLRERCYQPPFG